MNPSREGAEMSDSSVNTGKGTGLDGLDRFGDARVIGRDDRQGVAVLPPDP